MLETCSITTYNNDFLKCEPRTDKKMNNKKKRNPLIWIRLVCFVTGDLLMVRSIYFYRLCWRDK